MTVITPEHHTGDGPCPVSMMMFEDLEI